jgi:hypothetical protein
MATKIKKLSILAFVQLLFLALVSGSALAADCAGGNATSCLSDGKPGQVLKLLEVGLNFLAGAIFLGAVIMLTVAGIEYTSSNGNPQKVESAKKKIYNVLIGLAAFIFLYAFVEWLIPGGNSIL